MAIETEGGLLSKLMAHHTAVHTQTAYMITVTMTVMYSSTTYRRSVLKPAFNEFCESCVSNLDECVVLIQ